jgi:hypothetical protein
MPMLLPALESSQTPVSAVSRRARAAARPAPLRFETLLERLFSDEVLGVLLLVYDVVVLTWVRKHRL